ncbi:MAG: GatB/YqeY domain-containing protein [Chloroflexi bacterium]|nr:GatB/YqeY domain-containing protein [Chloroflexota bacterium]
MGLQEQLHKDLQAAMRQGDVVRRETIRLLLSAINYESISKGKPLEEPEMLAVLQRQTRQRRESIEEFRKGNRADLVDKESAELKVLLAYLPKQLSREEVAALAQQAVEEVGARGPADKGRVMGKLMPQVRGQAEGALVNTVVTELLEKRSQAG